MEGKRVWAVQVAGRRQADPAPVPVAQLPGVKVADEDEQASFGPIDERSAHPVAHLELPPGLGARPDERHARRKGTQRDIVSRRLQTPEAQDHVEHGLAVPAVVATRVAEVPAAQDPRRSRLVRGLHDEVQQRLVALRHLETDRDRPLPGRLADESVEGGRRLDGAVGLADHDDPLRLVQELPGAGRCSARRLDREQGRGHKSDHRNLRLCPSFCRHSPVEPWPHCDRPGPRPGAATSPRTSRRPASGRWSTQAGG